VITVTLRENWAVPGPPADTRLAGLVTSLDGSPLGGVKVVCADFLTGKTRYRDAKMPKVSLTCADGTLYGLTQEGEMFLMAPKQDRVEIASRFQATQPSKELAYAHPVVCGGRLYVRHGPNLYAYDVHDPSAK
jgi:hypothetical protein